jgi:hypothetical protein
VTKKERIILAGLKQVQKLISHLIARLEKTNPSTVARRKSRLGAADIDE